MKAIVVGAGLAGLGAAHRLRTAGWEVTVLEAGNHLGGRATTVREGAYTMDIGATQLSSGYREYLALCREIGLDAEILESSQIIGIARAGKVIEIDGGNPLSGLLAPVASLRDKLSMLNPLLDKKRLRPKLNHHDLGASHADDTESLRDYATRRLHGDAYEYLLAPLLRGNFLRSPDRATKLEWFAITDNFAGQKMLTLRGGMARLPNEIAQRLDVRLNSPAMRAEQVGDEVRVSWSGADGEREETVDACVIATRLPEAMAISPAYARLAAPLSARLRYSRGLVVHAGFRQPTRGKATGVFMPRPEQPRIGLLWCEHNKNPESAPPGHSLIACYFDDACADDCYGMPDEQVIGIAQDCIETLLPELRGQCDMTHVSRWPLGIPFAEPGVYREVHALRQQLSATDRIQYARDYFTCTGQNTAVCSGLGAAENLIRACPAP